MNKLPFVFTSILLLIGTILASASLAAPAHASSAGVVCIVPSGTVNCPTSPEAITGTFGSQLRLSVFIQNSSGLEAFAVILLADHAVLRPAGVDLTGSVLQGTPIVLAKCLSGILLSGSSCSSADTVDTIELAAASAPGSPLTPTPTTGLLFTAIYNITGTTFGTSLGFQTGCSNTSVPGGVCVTIANGTPNPVPETIQSALFSTSTGTDFVMSASPASQTVAPGSSAFSTITITSVNGFNGTVTLTLPPACLALFCPTWSISPSMVTVPPEGSASSTLTFGTTFQTSGTWGLTVIGTSGALVHNVTATFIVITPPPPDFTIAANPFSLSIVAGSSALSTITLTSLNGFNSTVAMALSVSPPGPTVTISPATVNLSSGGTGTATVFVSTSNSTSSGTYYITVTGSGGTLSHTATISLTVTGIQQGDFTISDSATSITIPVGSERQTIVTVTSLNGFSGSVQLIARPSSPAFACWFTTLTNTSSVFVPSGGSANQFPTCGAGRPAGAYNLTITGTSGSLSHSVILSVTVTDFSLAGPASMAFNAGSASIETLTFTSLFGFAGTISLTTSSSSSALSVSCPSTITLIAGGTATVTCSLASSTSGTYTATFTGTFVCGDCYYNGQDTNTLTTTVNVFGGTPDFSITAIPSSLTILQGSSGTTTITLTSFNNFTGTINLSAAVSPTGPGLSFSSSSITLAPGGVVATILTISTSTSTSPGSYSITVTGTSGSLSHTATVTLTVVSSTADFSMSATPSTIAISPGSSGTSTITITSINGFSGAVSLTVTVPPGIAASLSPTSISGSGTATLLVSGSSSGTFSVQVMGTSGSITHTVTVTVTITGTAVGVVCIVQSGATTCPVSPATLTGPVGTQLRVSVFIQGSGGLNGFDVTLLANHMILLPAGIDLTGSVLVGTPNIIAECLSGVLIIGPSCSNADTIDTLHLVATSALGSSITPTPTTGLLFTAIYNITGTTAGTSLTFQTGCSNTSVSGGICVTIANGSVSPVPETVQTATFSNAIAVPDFSLSASPTVITTTEGITGSSIITVAPINGFTGTVSLTTTSSPAGLSCTLTPTTVVLGQSQTSTLLCSGLAGTFTVAVTGTAGTLSHTVTVTFVVTVSDFTMTAIPNNLTIVAGGSATSTVTITSVNGFGGTVTVTASAPSGLTATVSPSSVTLTGGTATVALAITSTSSTPPGSYTVVVTGTSGSVSHTTAVSVVVSGVPDFSITATPTSTTIRKGGSASFTITIKGINSFNGTVSLSATISPVVKNSPTISLPTTVGPYSNSTLTISTARSAPIGTYTITVKATSGSIEHTVTISLLVTK